MSGHYPQWNTRPYGQPNPLAGPPPGPGANMAPPNYVNGPSNPAGQRPPQPGMAPPPPTNSSYTGAPPTQNMNSSAAQVFPPTSAVGSQSYVNGFKGPLNPPISGSTTRDSQPFVNGPPGPGMSMMVPKGPRMENSFSNSGPGPMATQPQMPGGGGEWRSPTPGSASYSAPPSGPPPSTVSSAPNLRHPAPPGGAHQFPPGPPGTMAARPPGPTPPPPTGPGVRPPIHVQGPPVSTQLPPPPQGMGQTRTPGPPPISASQNSQPGSDRPTGLPVPYHGQAQYSSQVHLGPDPNTSGLTPGSEPASQKSSRAPSPVPSQRYDALEGQFTPGSPPVQPFPGGQPPPPVSGPTPGSVGPAPPVSNAPGPATGGISGKRVYPQMPSGQYMHSGMPPAPGAGIPPPPTGPQPGVSTMPPGQPQPGMPPNMGMSGPPPPNMGAAAPPPNMDMGHAPPNMGMGPPQPNMGVGPPPPTGVVPPTSSGTPFGSGARPNYPSVGNVTSNSGPHAPNSTAGMVNSFGQMKVQPDATRPLNLLQEKNLLGPQGIERVKPNLPADFSKVNSNSDVFRCTLNAIPNTQSLLNKCRLPLGLLVHPFKDLSQLPVIQSSVIVRCRSCRTYINPFVSFVDARRWKCNLCYRVNELPEEFSYDPVSKTYGDPQRRPEIKSSTIEFIAPSEYMLRPPQPAVYLFVLDVSFNAVSTGYLSLFCETLLDELDRIPGDSRTQIGFITFDSCLQFYNLQEGLSQPQMLVVSDVEDVFLPLPEGLLVNIHESRDLVNSLLESLPSMFEGNLETGSALGPALQTAHKLLSPTGGRVSVFQTQLPTVGPGALKNREDPNERTGKKVQHLGPATDFYKKLALDCSAQQIAVDMFLLNAQYIDLSTIAGASKYSGGCLYYFPNFHTKSNPGLTERFTGTLRRYITRKIGFESVMRIRCSRGLTIHTFHGNFFVRSTDLLSLPNINPDSGFGMQVSIDDTVESNFCCFQAALLYTSSKGERRIRVHTLCIPVTNSITEVFGSADQQAIAGLLAKMAVDKSTSQSLGDARDALVNSCIDMLSAYGTTLTSSQRMGQLPAPHTLKFVPAYVLALLKYTGFRTNLPTRLDDRVFGLECAKSLPLSQFLLEVYPSLYPVHQLDDQDAINKGDSVISQPVALQLSSGNMDRHGVYLLDTNRTMYLWVGAAVSDTFCQEIFDVPNFQAVRDGLTELPELENLTSERLRTFVNYLNDQRPFPAAFLVIRDDSRARSLFLQHMVEDRSDSTFSYYEFLQHLQKEVK